MTARRKPPSNPSSFHFSLTRFLRCGARQASERRGGRSCPRVTGAEAVGAAAMKQPLKRQARKAVETLGLNPTSVSSLRKSPDLPATTTTLHAMELITADQ
ncbi:hypothetical protein GUJ93_ZPchr0013g34799 [Zizania palustris]|uniref:Uncharacterized protein n=1 Tax=Zizania palustris TaxID=103762 RepID=A0A8J6BWX5_ZIZPA|nr:hypothetical protein GUJ93_ZPchr0013g34799 [Zizania palustris]